jgi:hypothetical protein
MQPRLTPTNCIWCQRPFTPRRTGGSGQKFCSTGHRVAFWGAARRWAMFAIEAGVISVDCLKAPQTSVHAEGDASWDGSARSGPESRDTGP